MADSPLSEHGERVATVLRSIENNRLAESQLEADSRRIATELTHVRRKGEALCTDLSAALNATAGAAGIAA